MKKLCIFIVILFSANTYSHTMNDYDSIQNLKKIFPDTCKTISNTDGYLGYLSCTEKVYQYSEHLLSISLTNYRNKIEELSDRETIQSFNQNQQDWLNYRDSTCRYLSSSATKGSDAYTHLYQLCTLTENYNRMDFLNRPVPIS